MWPKQSPFSPPAAEDRPRGLPPKPPLRLEASIHDARVSYEELESWYNALNDLYNTRTGSRLPQATADALADIRDAIYQHLR